MALLEWVKINTAVCAKDQLINLKLDSFAIIVNSQSSLERGMHWVAFYKISRTAPLEFFDSFGLPLESYGPELVDFAQRYGKNVLLNLVQMQPNRSSSCGQFCLYFLVNRDLGRTYLNIVSDFNPTDKAYNDRLVTKFVLQNFQFPEFQKCMRFCKKRCTQDNVDLSSVCIQSNTRCFRLYRPQ
jgi:hypothetical protein